MKINENIEDALTIAGTTAGGAATGVGVTATIGGMGLAAAGTAIALPIVMIGAGLGAVIGGAFVLGKRLSRRQ